jgi:peptidyl-prolyl cis-trans isomerase D
MLKWLRKYSRSWFIAFAIGAIVVVFIFWGVGTMRSGRFQPAAEVNGEPILMPDFMRQYQDLVRQYQERYQGELTEDIIKSLRLKEQAMGRLIDEALFLQAAQRLGLRVTDGELREHIRQYPFFQREGQFSEKLYFQVLSRNRLSPPEFEEQERRRLLIQKVIFDLAGFAKVSDAELEEMFRLSREAVAVNYIELPVARFVKPGAPPEEEVAAYYQAHPEEFQVPPRARLSYLLFSPKDFLDKVKISPEEVAAYLREHDREFSRAKTIQARHLLLTLPAKAGPPERQALEKLARDLIKDLKGGKDFGEVARLYSQDAASRERGGDLGSVSRGQNPPEWDKTAFALKPGDVGQAATPQGIYIIKVEAVTEIEPLPDAAALAGRRLKQERAAAMAQDAAREARRAWLEGALAEVTQRYGVAPKETPPLGPSDPVPGLGPRPEFNRAALSLKSGETSRVTALADGFAVIKCLDYQAEHLPALDQVKEQVRQAVKKQDAKAAAQKEADRLLALLRQGKPMAQVAAQAGAPVKDSGWFSRVEGFMGQRQAEALTSAAFQLSKQHPYPAQPMALKDAYYLLAFKGRRTPDPQEWQQVQEEFRANFLDQKRQLLVTAWIEGERRRARIKVYDLGS